MSFKKKSESKINLSTGSHLHSFDALRVFFSRPTIIITLQLVVVYRYLPVPFKRAHTTYSTHHVGRARNISAIIQEHLYFLRPPSLEARTIEKIASAIRIFANNEFLR